MRDSLSSAQLPTIQLRPSTHQAAAPPLETSAAAPCRGHGLVCAALPFEDPGADHPEINALSQRHSLSADASASPSFLRVHRLTALVGAVARAWRGWFACKSTCKKEAVQDLIPEGTQLSSASNETVCSISDVSSSDALVQPFPAAATATVQCLQLPCPRAPCVLQPCSRKECPVKHWLSSLYRVLHHVSGQLLWRTHMGLLIIHKPAPQKKRACSPRTRLYGTGTGPAHGQRKAW